MSQVQATVGIKNSAFKRGLDEMRAQAAAWSNDFKSQIAGAMAFGAVAAFFSNFVSGMARVQDLSDRLGESTGSIQRIGNAAKLSGSDLEYVVKVLTALTLEAAKSSEKFEAAGISAAAFLEASSEQKILMLARAYEEANGNLAKMTALQELLGGKGQDMFILLANGVDALNVAFGETPVVADAAIKAVSALDDAFESFTTWAQQSLGAVIGLLAHLGAATMAVVQMMTEGGSFGGNYLKNIEGMLDLPQNRPGGGKGGTVTPGDDAKKAAKEKEDADEAAKALDEEMKELARSRMTDEQKITDLKKEQADLAAAAQDKTNGDKERLEAAKKVLEIQQEIEKLQKGIAEKKAEEEAKEAEKNKRKEEAAARAEQALAEEENKQKLEALDPKARIEKLKKQQGELYAEAAKLQEQGDREGAAKKRLDALKLNDELKAAQKEIDDKAKADKDAIKGPSVVSSSLGSIGGGGGVYVTSGGDPAVQELRRQTNLLERIAANTGSQGGSSPQNPF